MCDPGEDYDFSDCGGQSYDEYDEDMGAKPPSSGPDYDFGGCDGEPMPED